jgi:hypothetical protein
MLTFISIDIGGTKVNIGNIPVHTDKLSIIDKNAGILYLDKYYEDFDS